MENSQIKLWITIANFILKIRTNQLFCFLHDLQAKNFLCMILFQLKNSVKLYQDYLFFFCGEYKRNKMKNCYLIF